MVKDRLRQAPYTRLGFAGLAIAASVAPNTGGGAQLQHGDAVSAGDATGTDIGRDARSEATPATSEIEYLTRTYGLSVKRAELFLERQVRSEQILELLSSTAGDTWAGAYFDNRNGTLVVRATSSNALAVMTQLVSENWIKFEKARHSLADLESLWERAKAEMFRALGEKSKDDDAATLRDFTYMSKLDISVNSVVVRLGTHAWSSIATDLLVQMDGIKVGDSLDYDSTNSDETCPRGLDGSACFPLGGGVRVEGDGSYCTTAFTMVKSSARWASTAGHCDGSPWRSGGFIIGPTNSERIDANVDAQLIGLNDPALWKATNVVYFENNNTNSRAITSKISNPNNSLQGITICKVGEGSAVRGHARRSCGELTSVDGELKQNPGPSWDNQGVASFFGCKGDSGGAVYNHSSGRAYGIYRGGPKPAGQDCGQGPEFERLFTWINRAEAAMSASVLLTP